MNEATYRLLTDAAMIEHANAEERGRPFMLMAGHVRVSIDGDKWCVLFGKNLQDGVAGFGDSPDAASRDFDRAWVEKLAARRTA